MPLNPIKPSNFRTSKILPLGLSSFFTAQKHYNTDQNVKTALLQTLFYEIQTIYGPILLQWVFFQDSMPGNSNEME